MFDDENRSCIVFFVGFLFVLFLLWLLIKHKRSKNDVKEFIISYAPKNKHPSKNVGSPMGFIVNGEEGATLNLQRNVPYKFTYASPPGNHPLYFTTSSLGGEDLNGDSCREFKHLPELGDDKESLSSAVVVFGNNLPSHFYYQSPVDYNMGGKINLW